MYVPCECCVLHVEASATGRSVVQRSPTDFMCITVCNQVQQSHSTPALSRQKGSNCERIINSITVCSTYFHGNAP